MLADDVLQRVIDIKVQGLDLSGVGLVTEVVPVLKDVAEMQGQVVGPGVVVQPQEATVVILQPTVRLTKESFTWGQREAESAVAGRVQLPLHEKATHPPTSLSCHKRLAPLTWNKHLYHWPGTNTCTTGLEQTPCTTLLEQTPCTTLLEQTPCTIGLEQTPCTTLLEQTPVPLAWNKLLAPLAWNKHLVPLSWNKHLYHWPGTNTLHHWPGTNTLSH